MSYRLFIGIDEISDISENDSIVMSMAALKECLRLRGIPKVVYCEHDLKIEHCHPWRKMGCSSYNELYEDFSDFTGLHLVDVILSQCDALKHEYPEIHVQTENECGKENIEKLVDFYKSKENR